MRDIIPSGGGGKKSACCYRTFRTNKLFHIDSKQAFPDVEQHKYERDIPAGEGGDQQAIQLLPSKAGDQAEADIFIYPVLTSVADPNPDPHVFGPPGSGSGSFNHEAKIVRKTLISTVL